MIPPPIQSCLALALITGLALPTLPALATLPDDDSVWGEGLSYYSSFNGDSVSALPAEKGSGNMARSGLTPSRVTVLGDNKAISASTGSYMNNQTFLKTDAEAFTIFFRAQIGDVPRGLLYAFGANIAPGLAFRRDVATGSFAITTGTNISSPCILYTPAKESACSDWDYRTYALTYDANAEGDTLALYVDGELVGTGKVKGTLLDAKTQWGSRHSNPGEGEAKGNGYVDVAGIWTRVLTQEELKRLTADLASERPTLQPISFLDVPESFGTPPSEALRLSLTGTLSLEARWDARQTIGTRSANVAEITGSSNTYNVYGISNSSYGGLSILERDTWLKVSGGTFDYVVGGKDNYWKSPYANELHGSYLVELTGDGTTARNVLGGVYGCSNGDDDAMKNLTGNTLVTVAEGAKVSGNIIGSSVSMHGEQFTHFGDSMVRIYALQDVTDPEHGINSNRLGSGFVIGGSARADDQNRASGANITGDTAVEIVLPQETEGTFAKEIIGGSYYTGATGTFNINGSASVLIDAPATVTFAERVCAGSRGSNATIAGAATLTLKGGTFTNEIVPSYEGATAASSELVLAPAENTLDLSAATIGDFGAVTVNPQGGTLVLGTRRFATATLAPTATGTITFTLTDEELADRRAYLFTGEALPSDTLTLTATNAPEGWMLSVQYGQIVFAPPASDLTWQTPAAGSDWADGLEGFQNGDNATFGTTASSANERVTLSEDVRATVVSVDGDYTFDGAGLLTTSELRVSQGGTLTLGEAPIRTRRVYLYPTARVSSGDNSDGVALAEIQLTLNGEPIDLSGATATATHGQTSGEHNEHADDLLIDGDLTTKWYWNTTATSFSDCTITLDAGEGNAFVFDGYRLAMADQPVRNPTMWVLFIDSPTGERQQIDVRQYTEAVAKAWPKNNGTTQEGWMTEEPLAPQVYQGSVSIAVEQEATIAGTLAGQGVIQGDVVFAEGSTLKVPAQNVVSNTLVSRFVTVTGTVSGTVALDVGDVTLADIACVLAAPNDGLTFTNVPEHYTVRWYMGAYYLTRLLQQPIAAEISGRTQWLSAGWKDATGFAVTPNLWVLTPADEQQVSVTAAGEATLVLDGPSAIGAFTVEDSEHALTIEGTSALTPTSLTVNGPLATNPTSLTIPAGAAINGTLTYGLPSGTWALPNLTGTGTLAKTGSGTFNLANDVTVEPTLHIRQGTLKLTSTSGSYDTLPDIIVEGGAKLSGEGCAKVKYNDPSATFTFRDDAVFVFENGNSEGGTIAPHIVIENDGTQAANFQGSYHNANTRFTGGISGHGLLRFGGGHTNGFTISSVIADDETGALALEVASNAAEITVSGKNTYSGGTTLARSFKTNNAEALGRGNVTIAANGSLAVGGSLNIHAAYANSGSVSGAIVLCEGATLAAGTAVFDAVSVAEGAVVTFTALPEEMAAGTRLATWTEGKGPTDASAFSVPGWVLAVDATGLVVSGPAEPEVTLPESVAGEEGVAFDETAKAALIAAAKGAEIAAVTAVTGTANGKAMTTAEINDALACLSGEGLITADAEAGTLHVAYAFTVTGLALADGQLSVTATVADAEGRPLAIVSGATVELIPVSLGETPAEGEALATVTADGSPTVTLTNAAEAGTALFKVRVSLKPAE